MTGSAFADVASNPGPPFGQPIRISPMTADEMTARFDLRPHPEGGWYDPIWAAPATTDIRPDSTMIHLMLGAGERSHWHRVDAEETWLYLAGAPLILRRSTDANGPADATTLGPATGMARMAVVPPDHWQSAALAGDGDWTLVAGTVTPGFRFEGFTLAPPDFDIPS